MHTIHKSRVDDAQTATMGAQLRQNSCIKICIKSVARERAGTHENIMQNPTAAAAQILVQQPAHTIPPAQAHQWLSDANMDPVFLLRDFLGKRYDATSRDDIHAILENPALSLWLLEDPAIFSKYLDYSRRRYWALHSQMPVFLLVYFAKDSDTYVREAVAQNPQTPLEILTSLLQDPQDAVRIGLTKNPIISLDILETLFHDAASSVRVSAIFALGQRLVQDPQKHLIQQVHHAADDPSQHIRAQVALSPVVSAEIHEKLSRDPEINVRHAAYMHTPYLEERHEAFCRAYCPHLSPPVTYQDVLERGLSDVSIEAARTAARNPYLSVDSVEVQNRLWHSTDQNLRCSLVSHKNCPPAYWIAGVNDVNFAIRSTISKNPRIPATVLQKLIFDPSKDIRTNLALRQDLSKEQYQILADDEDYSVRSAAALHLPDFMRIVEHFGASNLRNKQQTHMMRMTVHPFYADPQKPPLSSVEIDEVIDEIAMHYQLGLQHHRVGIGMWRLHVCLQYPHITSLHVEKILQILEYQVPSTSLSNHMITLMIKHPAMTATMLQRLLLHPNPRIRKSVLDSRRLSKEDIQVLVNDPVEYVRRTVIYQLGTT